MRLILIFSIFLMINSTIIKEGYHFFDIFYYKDIYKNYLNQKRNNKCIIEDGPNCLYIKGKNMSEIGQELNTIYPDNKIFLKQNIENIYINLKNSVKSFNENKESNKNIKSNFLDDEVFSFDSPYVISLVLSFESYDEKTKYGDIYAPETIDNPFEIGRLTLTLFGRLRLTQKDSKKFENPIVSKEETPKSTYAYVESKEVIIKFNLKSTVVSLYIKKNKYNQKNKSFYLFGFKNENRHIITKIQNVPSNHWLKISGDGKKYDAIGIQRGFDLDNIVIYGSMEGKISFDQMKQTFSTFINEKISDAINQAVKNYNLKNGERFGKNDNGASKIIKIEINQNDIAKNKKEEDFDIPEEILKEINNNEKKKEKSQNQKKSDDNKKRMNNNLDNEKYKNNNLNNDL